jgi:extradiol dioxygenase family protein
MTPFHLAFKVKDIESTRKFYVDLLGCEEGRSTETWIDFNFFGHQLSAHVSHHMPEPDYCGVVDGIKVPIPHHGCIIDHATLLSIQQRLEEANITFIIRPQVRYQGQASEQVTLFVLDYSGNPIEFKAYKNKEAIFEK